MKTAAASLLTLLAPALVAGDLVFGQPRAPEITSGPFIAGRGLEERDALLTIGITNKFGTPISLAFDHNAGGPGPIGAPLAPRQLGASSTQFTFPTGWAGRIYVGKTINDANSKIESSYTGPPDIDVSYVDGYSLPVTCATGGTTVTGCNIPLFNDGHTCAHVDNNGPVCLNPEQNVPNGPASPFFAPCAGAAYTFPNDNGANVGGLTNLKIDCCVGPSCPAPARQHGKKKREVEAEEMLSAALRRRHARDLAVEGNA